MRVTQTVQLSLLGVLALTAVALFIYKFIRFYY